MKDQEHVLDSALAERLKAGYSVHQRRGELAGITAFFALTPILLMEMAAVLWLNRPDGAWWILTAAFFAGLLFADFASGFFHWAADNWGHERMPIVGTHFIRPFRHHHVEPKEMTLHGFIELNGNNCITSLPAFFFGYWVLATESPATGLFWAMFWLSTAYWVFGTNQFHAWAHVDNPPAMVRFLQWARIILPKGHHDRHHQFPHKTNYGITNGWTNPIVRALHFYEIIEWTVTRLTGVRPEHAKAAARQAPPSVV